MSIPENQTPGAVTGESPQQHGYTADKDAYLRRLRRIEGQVRGLQRMVEEERYCADVLTQVSSAQEALRGVSRAMLHNHLKHCAAEAIRSSDPERSEAMYEELLGLVFRVSA